MSRFDSNTTFGDDRRAVTAVLGLILIFAILVLTLTIYQAQIVPQQNAQVEFQHYQDVQNDLIQLRNSISTAGQADTSQFTRVMLGTTYQTRVATINPVDPAGTLRTSDKYNITVDNGDVSKNVSTRFLEYEPRYNEITAGSIWYEHSVLYVDERDRGPVRIIEDQNLMTNRSNLLRLTAVQNEYEETGTEQTVVEIYPTEKITESDLPVGELDITIPTRLNKSEYWGEQLGSDVDVTEDYYDTGVHRLDLSNLSISSNNFKFNTVGIREEPEADRAKQNVGPSSQRRSDKNGDTGDDSDEGQAGAIQVTPDVKSAGNSGKYEFGLENTGNIDATIVAIGVNDTTVSSVEKVGGKNNDDILTAGGYGQIVSDVIQIDSDNPNQANRYDFSTDVVIAQNDEQLFEFDRFRDASNGNGAMKGSSVTITLWFSDGTSTTLLLDPNT